MKLVKVAAGALNQTPLDWTNNVKNILSAIEDARSISATVLCLPELCITGYGCEDTFMCPGHHETAVEKLFEIAEHTSGMIVSVGLPVTHAGGLFNTACLLVDGEIVGFVAKQHLAGDGIHYEPRWFKRWPDGIQATVEFRGKEYPLGDYLFDIGGIRFGFEICEDAWVGTRPGSSLASRGVDVLLNPSASHFAFGKNEVRKRFVLEGSRAFQVTYVYSNLLGNEAGRAIYDGDAMIACGGKMLAEAKRFSYERQHLTAAVVDVDSTRVVRARTGSFEPDVDGDESDVIHIDFEFPEIEVEKVNLEPDPWEKSEHLKEEEFTRAVSLALFDYLRKSRSRGVVVSLSGGADSAAVAVLSASMLQFAEQQIGMTGLQDRLSYCDFAKQCDSLESLRKKMITTVYQATRNSSDTTRNAAADVAKALSSTHYVFDVDSLVNDYVAMVEKAIERPLDWETDDIALQNIQARVRSPGVWMLANINNALLLSTSNRSEAAVGYATMDGDTSGGLSPIAGIDKAFLRQWLKWMETEGPLGCGKLPALKSVNVQQPTAELRPLSEKQTDEDDLMPYAVLDYIERLAIRDKLIPDEVLRHLKTDYSQYPEETLVDWTKRFFQLFARNQWKRERYAPSFHLDDENLDPKTWCRFPILSGGFSDELRSL